MKPSALVAMWTMIFRRAGPPRRASRLAAASLLISERISAITRSGNSQPHCRSWRLSYCLTDRSSHVLNLAVAVTVDEMIVHHADCLHVRVDHRRSDEAEPAALQILAEGVGFG